MSAKNTTKPRPIQDRGLIDGERWAVILDGYYAVSDHGRLMRTVGGVTSSVAGKLLNLGFDGLGRYLKINFCIDGMSFTRLVHKLVADAFLGHHADGSHVNHKDGIKTNNRASNLEFVTRKENMHHSYHLGFHKTKLSESQVSEIREMLKLGIKQKEIAKKFGVSGFCIHSIKSGKSRKIAWSHSE